MKKLLIIVPLALVLIIGGLFGAYIMKMNSETSVMTPLPTGEISEGVYAIHDGFVNLFLVKSGESYIAIDAGMNKSTIQAGLEELQIDPLKVEAVLLTHSDGDHIKGLELFPNAQVYLSEEEEQMVDGTTKRALIFTNALTKPYTTFRPGTTLNIEGLHIETVHAPGHTPGSVCYLIEGNLFVGDCMSIVDGKAGKFNEFFTMDMETLMESLFKIARVKGVEQVISSHYGLSKQTEKLYADLDSLVTEPVK